MKRNNKNIKRKGRAIPFTLMGRFSFVLCAFSLICSCKKFVEVPPPSSQLVTASVFNNNAAATSALTDIYQQMYGNSESPNMALDNGVLSDELTNYGSGSSLFLYYIDQMNATATTAFWTDAYRYIYESNAIIAGLQQYSGTSPAVKQQLLGEAYFIRAFWHFYLTNCFGAVPVALTTDYTVTNKLSRTPRVQVLQQVIEDLTTAKNLLNNNYVDASDTAVTTDRVRPTKYVAEALLARAYLYLGDYSKNTNSYKSAESAADSVINNSSEYSLCTNLSGTGSVFLANSTEAIWQLYTPLPASNNTIDGNDFILLAAPSVGMTTISPQLMNAFEPGDQRQVNWIGSITEGTSTYYFPYKYKVQSGGSPITEYTMVLRLAEQYLIRAEARAEQNNLPGAASDLNVIRNRAGLANTTASTQSDLLTAILHERQVEMFTEWGARWFDLNRAAANTAETVNVNTVMGVVTPLKGGTWSPYKGLYPIPQTEMTVDYNLTQNAGY